MVMIATRMMMVMMMMMMMMTMMMMMMMIMMMMMMMVMVMVIVSSLPLTPTKASRTCSRLVHIRCLGSCPASPPRGGDTRCVVLRTALLIVLCCGCANEDSAIVGTV